MITFDNIAIDEARNTLNIKFHIDENPWYNDVHLKYIKIDNQETFSPSGPSLNPIYEKTYEEENPSRDDDITIYLDTDFPTPYDNDLLIIYVKADGEPASDTPCGYEYDLVVGVGYYQRPVYLKIFKALKKDFEDVCEPPKRFINEYLKYKMVDLAISTGNLIEAVKYYKEFFKN